MDQLTEKAKKKLKHFKNIEIMIILYIKNENREIKEFLQWKYQFRALTTTLSFLICDDKKMILNSLGLVWIN